MLTRLDPERVGVVDDDFQRWVDSAVASAKRARTTAKLDALVRASRRLEDLVFEAAARPRRPWWWWLAFGFYASVVITALWVMYRTVAGHPILGGLMARLGG